MGMKIFRDGWWALMVLATLAIARSAPAIYLDEDQHVSLRARVYSQAAFRTMDSEGQTTPRVEDWQLVQHRNFYNPELEAKLGSYLTWMRDQRGFLPLIAPDSLDFRLAAWGFYDGVFDYGPRQFAHQQSINKVRFTEATRLGTPTNPFQDQVLRGQDETLNARDIYGHQQRVNELYLSYTKGPLFVRFGRQAISWGESDTIAILDQNNPFDLTLGIPGILEDLDEARIPLWTLRTSYALFDNLGPFSSGFLEAYWVPGDLDNTTATVPEPATAPYSPPGPDPAFQAGAGVSAFPGVGNFKDCGNPNAPNPLCVVLIDHVPGHSLGNSRWGVRTQTVVARDYTVSAWMYTTFPNTPVPRIIGRMTSSTLPKGQNNMLAIEFVHQLVPVIGLSNTFFFEPLDGIIRMEAEYFNREPGFIPGKNLTQDPAKIGITKCTPHAGKFADCIPDGGTVPHADFLRWEIGFDRFFFFRPLNPTNSFTWVTALVGSWNLDETSKKDFYDYGQQKPGSYPVLQPNGQFVHAAPANADFVELPKVDLFVQTHLQTDYLHGRLSPQITVLVNGLGTYIVAPQLVYRWTDSLLFTAAYTTIGGAFYSPGFFYDRDQIALRATYQLN